MLGFMPTITVVIAGIYIFACLLGVVGIVLTANVVVVVREGLGYPEVRIATGKKVADGFDPGKFW
jgi:hypothetical protein